MKEDDCFNGGTRFGGGEFCKQCIRSFQLALFSKRKTIVRRICTLQRGSRLLIRRYAMAQVDNAKATLHESLKSATMLEIDEQKDFPINLISR